jgi:hypothetical protein
MARVTKKVKDAANTAVKETKKMGKAVAKKTKAVLGTGSAKSRKKTTGKKSTAKSSSK